MPVGSLESPGLTKPPLPFEVMFPTCPVPARVPPFKTTAPIAPATSTVPSVMMVEFWVLPAVGS